MSYGGWSISALATRLAPWLQALRPDAAGLAGLLALALVLWTLAYQVPLRVGLAIGGDRQTHRREDDAPFLHNLNASEPASAETWQWWTLEPGYSYRWTRSHSRIELPGIGAGRWLVTLHASSGRPAGEPAASTWHVGDRVALPLTIPAHGRIYRMLTASSPPGDLTIRLETPAYVSPGDPRDLGFVLRDVQVAALATPGLRLPALAQLAWLTMVLLLAYPLARWLALTRRSALLVGLACALFAALLLAGPRLVLTLATPRLAGLLLGCWGLALLAWTVLRGWQMPRQTWQAGAGAVVGLVLLAFALRMGGMLHPAAIFSDHRLHANNLLELALGHVHFTEGLPASRGGGQAPYPPGVYLLLAPALTLLPADMASRVGIVQTGVALLDSLVVALLWLVLHGSGLGRRAALAGAALYLLPLPLLVSFSIGEYANLGGQALATFAVGALALGIASHPQPKRSTAPLARSWPGPDPLLRILIFVLLLCLALFSHAGVTLSLAFLLVAASGLAPLFWLLRQRDRWDRRKRALAAPTDSRVHSPLNPGILIGGSLLAAWTAGQVYYAAPRFLPIYAQRLGGGGSGHAADDLFWAVLGLPGTVGATLLHILSPASRLLPLLVVGGLVGLLLLWQRDAKRGHLAPLTASLLAWWLGTLLSFLLLLGNAQGLRWQHFLVPGLCLGGGVAFSAIWRRGGAGRLVALTGLVGILAYGWAMWIGFIADYLH